MKTVDEIAKKEKKSPRWVRMQMAAGKYQAIKIAGTWLVLEPHELLLDVRKLPAELREALVRHAKMEADKLMEIGIAV